MIPALILGSSLLAAACMNRNDSDRADTAETAVDSADSTSAEGDVMMSAVDGADGPALAPITIDAVVGRISANITARYQPASCATITQTQASIKVVYDDCTGPRGLVHVSGELALAVTVSSQGAITVHGTSTDLAVNGASLEIDATGTYTSSGTAHSLAVTTTGTGTGPRGAAIDHEGSYTVHWDTATQCHDISGEWSTELGLRTRSNSVTLSRCAAGCPTGSITHTFLRGQAITVTFDATATAMWTATDGRSGMVTLNCQ
jgi:hypothetical protein